MEFWVDILPHWIRIRGSANFCGSESRIHRIRILSTDLRSLANEFSMYEKLVWVHEILHYQIFYFLFGFIQQYLHYKQTVRPSRGSLGACKDNVDINTELLHQGI